jgi:phosphatidylserine decarboxylase
MNQSNSYDRLKPENLLAGLFVAAQYLLPHHFLSALMYRLTRIESPGFKNALIRKFIALYGVEMGEALESDPTRYRCFNEFFTRALLPDTRPVSRDGNAVVCPADGVLSQAGDIEDGYLFQAKGHDYALLELLGGDMAWTHRFEEGGFATVYLSPKDYHRVHMPYPGSLKQMIHVPGRLFSVNDTTTRRVPRLFARNERVICLFETDLGPMAVILVGAIFVASIETVWAGLITPASRQVRRWDYPPGRSEEPIRLDKGEEMGRFNMGSTVILLFGKDRVEWLDALEPGQTVKMGQTLGNST